MNQEPTTTESPATDVPPTEESTLRAAAEAYAEANAVSGDDLARAGEPAADDPLMSIDELVAALATARGEADAHRDQYLRARAEHENVKRRHATELEKAHKFALEGFARELLQVRDSLELGHNAAQDQSADVGKLREGTELTLKLLRDVMEKFGVAEIDPLDQPFDPAFHQAISMQPRSDVPPNTVVAVVQKGYSLNGRLMRPAMVLVSQQGS